VEEPTADQCTNRERVDLCDGQVGWACWYPTMGGYVGKALVVADDNCHDVFVWHNGDFPFAGQDPPWEGMPVPSPSKLHHCDGSQFVAFGQFLMQLEADRG
jgi:hypothetical protein